MSAEPVFDYAAHVARFSQASHHATNEGYIVWRRGSGDNVELLHIRAYRKQQGVGKRLLLHMVKELQNDPPYKTVFGFTRISNDAARAFYLSLGFTLTEVDGVYADGRAVLFSQSYESLVTRLSKADERYYSEAGKFLAVVARSNPSHLGIKFYTDPDSILQVGKVTYPINGRVIRHVHNPVTRNIDGTSEVLYVLKGKVLVTIGGEENWQLYHLTLEAGDLIIFDPRCVHGIEIPEETTLLECKNGPYMGRDIDKTFLEDPPSGSVPTA